MRPAAEVDVAVLGVKADCFYPFRQVVEQFDFIVFPLAPEDLNGLFTTHLAAFKRIIRLGDLSHPGFDPFEILGCEALGIFKIVIEAVFDGRADAHLNTRKRVLDRLGHHMGHAVAEDRESLRRRCRNRLDSGVAC
ncbi:MAG: hypothetical protein ACD_87C00092G0001 [uncultured bacterium]|nr:MAG: hypothetical protein ACD_87C00092G0001 [uncultured bacterium]